MDNVAQEVQKLKEEIEKTDLPEGLKESVSVRLDQLKKLVNSPSFLPEFDRINKYVGWITKIPWSKRTQDRLDIQAAQVALDRHHHGLGEIKERILEYISVMKLNSEKGSNEFIRAPILCFVGLVGTGKTTIAASIAEALSRKYARIPFGGMGDPLDLRGQSRMHAEAEPGKVIKALIASESKNPIILLDEIDRVTDRGRDSIMGVLVELLDPKQNNAFVDHYIDYPVDLSEVLFIATANNTTNIATAVLDRLEPIVMPSYTDQEKITIGKKYMLPRIIKNAGLSEDSIVIEDEVWSQVVRPLGFDAGIRSLERTIDGVVRKVAKTIVEKGGSKFVVNKDNVKQYIPQ